MKERTTWLQGGPLCKAAVVAALGVGGGEVPKAVPLHNLLIIDGGVSISVSSKTTIIINEESWWFFKNCTSNNLLTLACQRVGARTPETSRGGTSYKAPMERGEELARLLVRAPWPVDLGAIARVRNTEFVKLGSGGLAWIPGTHSRISSRQKHQPCTPGGRNICFWI